MGNVGLNVIRKMKVVGIDVYLLVIFLVLAIVRSSFNGYWISNWKFTHFMFNYEDEFLKRGFIGEIIRLIHGNLTELTAQLYSAGVILFIFVTQLLFSISILKKFRIRPVLLFLLFAAISPATLQHQMAQLGKYDSFLIVVAILSLVSIAFTSMNFSFVIIVATQVIAIFIHEAALLLTAPVVYALWFLYFRPTHHHLYLFVYFSSLITLTILVFYLGVSNGLSFDERLEKYSAMYGTVNESSLSVLYRDISDNINYSLLIPFAKIERRIFDHLTMFVFLSPYFLFFLYFARTAVKEKNLHIVLCLLASLTPLLLYPLAHDYFRWWSFVFVNLFICFFFLLITNENMAINFFRRQKYLSHVFIFGIVISLILGPLLAGEKAFGFSDKLAWVLKNIIDGLT